MRRENVFGPTITRSWISVDGFVCSLPLGKVLSEDEAKHLKVT